MTIGAVAMAQCILNVEGARSVFDPAWVQRNHGNLSEDLTFKAQQGLDRVNSILGQILNNEADRIGFSTVVGAGSKGDGLCETVGNRKNAVILFSPHSLEDISGNLSPTKNIYLTAWLDQVSKLPDDAACLKSKIASADEGQVSALMGLYRECAFCLDADEIYFILKHELSHIKQSDNEKRLALRLVAATCALIFLNLYSDSVSPAVFFALAALSLFFPQLCVKKSEYPQELRADACGIRADARAKKGAKSYFKKMAVYELAAERYYQLTGKAFNSGTFAAEKICHTAGIGHPAALERYSAVMSA
ncbi:M48 family metalloprotease [Estrella lausannensis]|uniref:Peptidase n=1 Tax=Estrella lausannensis TaxID=483423 RepID=A0A0H5DQH8_9BACT|nr:M48 family metalloprotease [Estrella lausannensis]CRX38333.1 Peptidase [Estrella lausannensis]